MEPGTLIGIGALVSSAIAVILNLVLAYRTRRKERIQESAALIEAENQMRLGSVEAAQRIITMYGDVLLELKERVRFLEQRVKELEYENSLLRATQNGQTEAGF